MTIEDTIGHDTVGYIYLNAMSMVSFSPSPKYEHIVVKPLWYMNSTRFGIPPDI